MAGAYDREGAGSSDAILAAARASLKDQQAGGRRVTGKPIGQRSAALRRDETKRKAIRFALLVTGLLLLANFFTHWLLEGVVVAAVAILVILAILPRQKPLAIPTLDNLRSANPKALVGQTQLWLEAQRPALPAPALDLVGRIGGQLDGLALQLDRIDEATPALTQVRALVGEQLPNLVKAYTDIPPGLRKEAHAGASPDEQLTESLGRISGEIDSVTRQLAEGKLDALAIQTRYLDYKYGGET